jgi:hypothetical protein
LNQLQEAESKPKAMTKVLFVTWAGHKYARDRLAKLKLLHERLGHITGWTHFYALDLEEQIKGASLAYVWNGAYDCALPLVKKLRNEGAVVIFTELAWFPQSQFLYFDTQGTNAQCSLHQDDLSWLEEEDFDNLRRFSQQYRGARQWQQGEYIFVPLQLSSDMQIKYGESFEDMRQFIHHVRQKFAGSEIIFRKHPKDENSYDIDERGGGNLFDLMLNCKMVYGLNSTVTLESALVDVPTMAIARSFLNIGPDRRHALAALVARQVPISTVDFEPWAKRGRGLEHLQSFL